MARILVIDDEPHVRELIGIILQGEGHEVATADNGMEALGALDASLPDLIVLDLAMPGMDGWRFLEELYDRGLRRKTRVVIISGRVEAEDAPERSYGNFLAKPFDPQALITIVENALEQEPVALHESHDRSAGLARLLTKMARPPRANGTQD